MWFCWNVESVSRAGESVSKECQIKPVLLFLFVLLLLYTSRHTCVCVCVCITATALFQAYIYMNVTSVAQKWTKSGQWTRATAPTSRDEHASESNDAAAERERERERDRRERVSEE